MLHIFDPVDGSSAFLPDYRMSQKKALNDVHSASFSNNLNLRIYESYGTHSICSSEGMKTETEAARSGPMEFEKEHAVIGYEVDGDMTFSSWPAEI
jgi:hypothetical protein